METISDKMDDDGAKLKDFQSNMFRWKRGNGKISKEEKC